jgi:L-alanine-DL-glutamate epimerase-like enolase superfamily enzyme
MKITAVTTAVVQANFDYTFVRIHTDEAVTGTGEAFMAPGLPATIRELGEVVIGHDPRNVTALRTRLMLAVSGSGGASGAGMAYNAVSGIEAALWDLVGKALDQPVWQLLGGRYRDSVEVYADLHAGGELESLDRVMRYRRPFWSSPSGRTEPGRFFWEAAEGAASSVEAAIARGRAAIAAGFRYVKFDLDVFTEERQASSRSVARLDALRMGDLAGQIREALGNDVEIAFDCHWRFDVPSALAVARAVAPARPLWLEDPIPPDPVSLGRLASGTPVPIATGENTYLVEGFEALAASGGAHIFTPDVQKVGGILETVRIAELAARRFLPIAPHCIASPLGFTAAVHACAASSNVLCLEFHGSDVPFWDALITAGSSIISGGQVRVPMGPGLGVELDLDVVRRYSAPGEAVFDEPPAR